MREIVFDTETTGLNPEEGDKLVEIGMVELMDLVPTGKTFHTYINPLRDMPMEAFRVHGLSADFLADFPTFGDPRVADAMLDFIGDSQLVAHNAEFDRGFINYELKQLGLPEITKERCIDTVLIARKQFPGAPANLDALCRRFNIDLKDRTLHGALLDARLLAAVYLELKGGRERSFGFLNNNIGRNGRGGLIKEFEKRGIRPKPLPSLITPDEAKAHQEFIAKLGEDSYWAKLNAE